MSYFDLGKHSWPVSTRSRKAQKWFDRGLLWTYGYNHEEAVRCFKKSLKHDPGLAMAHWGIGYASGPNYNMEWHLFDDAGRAQALAVGYDSVAAARACADDCTQVELALIEALSKRYPQRDVIEDMTPWNDDFANAMRLVFQKFPDQLDIRTIFVEALLNRFPWRMWDLHSGAPTPGADSKEAREVCETAMRDDPGAMQHPGLLHLYVHLMEMSSEPEAALKAGDALRRLCPDAGHLIHMPTHIDVLCGDYQAVRDWNEAAVQADLKYYNRRGAFDIYTGYRQHNYHFAMAGAMFLGQFEPAMAMARGIRETTPEEMLRMESPPMADYFEAYLAFEPHILIRFGKWREATELPLPNDPVLYCTGVANTLYARALGHAALGEVAKAEQAQEAYRIATEAVPWSRYLHTNKVRKLLEIGEAMLAGEIDYRKGNYSSAFEHLRHAVHLDDNLNYDEPWGWMQPTRHALGALLFEQGHVDEAEHVFRQDLGLADGLPRACIHPDNIWALKGLYDCLSAKGESSELAQIEQRLTLAQARTDIPVKAPCGCAQAAMH